MILVAAGEAEPSFIVSHELPLDRAPVAYEHFDKAGRRLDQGRPPPDERRSVTWRGH